MGNKKLQKIFLGITIALGIIFFLALIFFASGVKQAFVQTEIWGVTTTIGDISETSAILIFLGINLVLFITSLILTLFLRKK